MNKKLAGTLFVFNGNKFDYNFKEAIQCLLEFTGYVIVAAGGDDNTYEDCLFIALDNPDRMKIIFIPQEDWDNQHGYKKLNYFTNIAIEEAKVLGYEYQFNIQADEILHEKSYPFILKAIETNKEGFLITRHNLWHSPYLRIDVEGERNPCSYNVIRLAKVKYLSCGDAESLDVPSVCTDFLDEIRMYHMGFVRKREVMKAKILNMQEAVFELGSHDAKLDDSDIFIPERWFDPKKDLKPIDEPLPKLIRGWAKQRIY